MDRLFAERLFGVPWIVLAAIALIVAVVYLFMQTTGTATGWRWVMLRWGHSLCWLLLAAAALAKAGLGVPGAMAVPLGIAGGVVYAAFIATMLTQPPAA